MINKELKHLSRHELVDIIYQLKKNEQEMQEQITLLKNELEDKQIRISNAGSIADAAVSITNVFSTAQTTADIYLQEIVSMKEKTEKECEKKIKDTQEKVKKIIADGERQFNNLKTHYEIEYKKWMQLKSEVRAMEQTKNHELSKEEKNA